MPAFQVPQSDANTGFLAVLAQFDNVPKDYSATYLRRWLVIHMCKNAEKSAVSTNYTSTFSYAVRSVSIDIMYQMRTHQFNFQTRLKDFLGEHNMSLASYLQELLKLKTPLRPELVAMMAEMTRVRKRMIFERWGLDGASMVPFP